MKRSSFFAMVMVLVLAIGLVFAVVPSASVAASGPEDILTADVNASNSSIDPDGLVQRIKSRELIEQQAERDYQMAMKIAEEQELQSLQDSQIADTAIHVQDNGDSVLSSSYVFTWANSGNKGTSQSGIASVYASFYTLLNRNYVKSQGWGPYGWANAWSWTGAQFTGISGSGYVSYHGQGKAQMWGFVSGQARFTVKVKLYDYTTGSYLADTTVIDHSESNSIFPITFSQSFDRSQYASLQASHTYVAYVVTYGYAQQYAAGSSYTSSRDSSYYTDWSTITVF